MKPDADQLVRDALAEVGVEVESAWDIVNGFPLLRKAVEPLTRLLPQLTDTRDREGVVRALTDKNARPAALEALIQELERAINEEDDMLAWAVGNALEIVAFKNHDVFEKLCSLAVDPRIGAGRKTVALAIAKTKHPDAAEFLASLLDDPIADAHALSGLRLLNAKEYRKQVEPFLDDKRAFVRREAKKALAKFDK